MVTTWSMTYHARYDAGLRRLDRGGFSLKRPHACEFYPAKPPHLQCPASRKVTLQQCSEHESNLSKLRHSGIVATPVDWLPVIINIKCGVTVERYEQYVSEIDDSIDLDRVRRAFILVKAQARTLATLFIPVIREFLLQAMMNTRCRVLETKGEATESARDVESTVHANDAVVIVEEMILFFEDLIKDVVDHCKIPNH
jgi:hypothetical protein